MHSATIAANTAWKNPKALVFEFFAASVKSKAATDATAALITKVAGAYIANPINTSARAAPRPAAAADHTGPSKNAPTRMKTSPRLKYPIGRGTAIKVPMQVSAAKSDAKHRIRNLFAEFDIKSSKISEYTILYSKTGFIAIVKIKISARRKINFTKKEGYDIIK